VQYAVDRAGEGCVVKLAAGVYTGVQGRPRSDVVSTGTVTQVVYVSKTVTIRGGYTPTNWAVSDPAANPTTLDAQGLGRVFYVSGVITSTIEGLRITGGDSAGLGGSPEGFDAGGGVYLITATAVLRDNRVFSNTSGAGGGVYAYASKPVLLQGNTISANVAGDGGGLYFQESEPVLDGNTIVANAVHWAGGGLCLKDSAGVLSRTTVASNSGYLGGGLCLGGSDVILTGTTVMSNAGGAGGGLYLEESIATLAGSTVLANQALRGGGLFLGFGQATLASAVVARNQAENEGDGLYLIGSSARILHTTVARNGLTGSAGDDGHGTGIYAITSFSGDPTTVVLTNTILVSHTLGITVGTGSSATAEGTLWGNTADWGGGGTVVSGTVNVWGDPAFVDPDGGDYHVRPGSAAVDAGVDAGATPLSLYDIDGDPRTDGRPDIGADELVAALAVTKRAAPDPVKPGARLTYTIRVTNTGDLDLRATVTDTLPLSVTLGETTGGTLLLPGGAVGITWTMVLSAPGGAWAETVAVTVAEGYVGPLANLVVVTTEEGAKGAYTETSTVASAPLIYLPLVVRDQAKGPGFADHCDGVVVPSQRGGRRAGAFRRVGRAVAVPKRTTALGGEIVDGVVGGEA
jgi:uncharacterized repeat protein (TIGR01451 family)